MKYYEELIDAMSNEDFYTTEEVLGKITENDDSIEYVGAILKFMEANPYVDYGMPGPVASMPYAEMHSHAEQIYLDNNEQYFIVWDEATLPIVLCLGKSINECWDDVMAVAFDTYFVAESTKKVIGIRH